jgi:hypothetical protein
MSLHFYFFPLQYFYHEQSVLYLHNRWEGGGEIKTSEDEGGRGKRGNH